MLSEVENSWKTHSCALQSSCHFALPKNPQISCLSQPSGTLISTKLDFLFYIDLLREKTRKKTSHFSSFFKSYWLFQIFLHRLVTLARDIFWHLNHPRNQKTHKTVAKFHYGWKKALHIYTDAIEKHLQCLNTFSKCQDGGNKVDLRQISKVFLNSSDVFMFTNIWLHFWPFSRMYQSNRI